STRHLAVDDVALRATPGIRSLLVEDLEVVTMERLVGIGLNLVSFARREGHQRAQRTPRLAFWRSPIQSVVLAFVTDELLGVLFSAVVRLGEVLRLGIGNGSTDINRRQFIAANPAGKNLFLPRSGVEHPLSGIILLQRDGERLIVGARDQ